MSKHTVISYGELFRVDDTKKMDFNFWKEICNFFLLLEPKSYGVVLPKPKLVYDVHFKLKHAGGILCLSKDIIIINNRENKVIQYFETELLLKDILGEKHYRSSVVRADTL